MKMKKIFLCFLVLCTLLCTPTMSALTCSAAPVETEVTTFAVEPRFSNVAATSTAFTITNTGLACVSTGYYGIDGVTTRVFSIVYLEKKVLGLFWTRVDIGTTDDEWVDTSTDVDDRFSHTFQLNSKGTYRAVFKIVAGGTNGDSDIVDEIIEKKYS